MNTTEVGRKAERAACVYLEMRGFSIIEQNFRRPRCEIDIIAQKDGVIHCVEVKYRASDAQGGGLEAITASKLAQMRRGAHIWSDEVKWRGPITLSAIELEGKDFAVVSFIEDAF